MMMEEVDLEDTPLGPPLERKDSLPLKEDEPPDPRIQVELERLNTSTDLINKLEVDLDEGRMMFRQMLSESTQQINNLTKKLGKCIEQARPYYEARFKAKQSLTEAQKSAVRYERAVSQHSAAREMVQLAEEGLSARGCIFDSTWQEMLNHATTKVNDAEREKIESANEHKEKSLKYHESEARVKVLQKELKRAITKSSLNARRSLLQLNNLVWMHHLQLLPYFDLKAAINQRLEEQKRHVRELEDAVSSAKMNYSQALANLETISDQIHKTRQSRLDLGIRGVGVGAESPGPPFCVNASLEESPPPGSRMDPSVQSPIKASKDEVSKDILDSYLCKRNQALNEAGITGEERSQPSAIENKASTSLASKQASLESCDGPVIEASTTHAIGTAFSGWQFIGYSTATSAGQNLLSVDDRDSVVSDSESLTSIEMLSEEAIANLMLEDELQEASHSICSSLESPAKNELLEATLTSKELVKKALQPLSTLAKCEGAKEDSPSKGALDDHSDLVSPADANKSSNKDDQPTLTRASGNANKSSPVLSDRNRDSSSDSGGAWELVGSCSSNSNDTSNKSAQQFNSEALSPARPQTLLIERCTKQSSSSSSLPSSSPSDHSSADLTPSYAPLCNTPETPHSSRQNKSNVANDPKTLDI